MFHKEEFIALKVDAQRDGAAVQLIAVDDNARSVFAQILVAAPDSLVWHSMGNRYHNNQVKDYVVRMYQACGGIRYMRTEGNVTTIDYDGAIKICLDFTSATDLDATTKLVQFAWYCGVGVDLDQSTSDQLRLVAADRCKVCTGSILTAAELEWKICKACSDICDHTYHMGLGHYKGTLMNMPYCHECGRGDPSWKPTGSPLEEMVKTVTEGSLNALVIQLPDGSSATITRK